MWPTFKCACTCTCMHIQDVCLSLQEKMSMNHQLQDSLTEVESQYDELNKRFNFAQMEVHATFVLFQEHC